MTMNMPKHVKVTIVAGTVLCALFSVYALYEVCETGAWPKSWPKELEPLRNQSRTLTHETVNIHEIAFSNRVEFESAWPHILGLKGKGAPIKLLASPDNRLGITIKAGVRLCGPIAWRDRPDFTCFQAGSETAAIARGVAAELGPLTNTQAQPEVGPFAPQSKP